MRIRTLLIYRPRESAIRKEMPRMKTVGDILKKKGSQVFATTPQSTVFEALKLMAEHNVGALLVLDGNKDIAGVLSERDYARKVILHGKSSSDLSVSEVMSNRVFTVTPNETMDGCMSLMTDKHIRHLPVLENDALIGLVSIGDVVKGLIEEKVGEIRQLENYIYGIQ